MLNLTDFEKYETIFIGDWNTNILQKDAAIQSPKELLSNVCIRTAYSPIYKRVSYF